MTAPNTVRGLLERVRRVGAVIADLGREGDESLRRDLMLFGSKMFLVAGVLWGCVYVLAGETAPGLIPLAYSLVSAVGVMYYRSTGRFAVFRASQLVLILLLPALLQLSLGGFVGSGAVILWGLISPFGALLFDDHRRAPGWFGAYLLLVILCGLIQPRLDVVNDLPITLIAVSFVANVGTVSAIAFLLLYGFVHQREAMVGLLRTEREKSEALLLNILPRSVAEVLRDAPRTIAEHVDEASVLFADMVGFTPLGERLSASAVVDLLNRVFSHFDRLVVESGVEKIRTVGDSYMAAAGVPVRRADHATVLADLGLAMHLFVESDPQCLRLGVRFRIGINSGPMVAGVIGLHKFTYDVWGDAVNTASRMESHAEPGTIQITADTYRLVRDEFECVPRGTVDVKGKGDMETWYVVRRWTESTDGVMRAGPAG